MAKVRSLLNTTKLIKQVDADQRGSYIADRHIRHPRSPIVLSTTHWLARGRYIALWINPLSTTWSLGRRETVTKTAAGAVRNTWRNRFRNTYYDEFTVDFTFQTGNIMPSAGVPASAFNDSDLLESILRGPATPPGLQNFYDFISMLDQPLLLGQSENRHIIVYRSRLFPRLRMSGYWLGTTPLAFTDDGNKGNMATWTATFQCYSTSPSLWSWRREQLSGVWSEWYAKNGQELVDQELLRRLRIRRRREAEAQNTANLQGQTLPAPPTDPDQSPPKSSSKVVVGKRANSGVKRIGIVTGDVQPGVGPNPQPATGGSTTVGKRVVSPSNTPAVWPFTSTNLANPANKRVF